MSMSDPIADMLTRIRNAIMASYDTVDVPASKLKIALTKILKSEGFIRNYKILSHQRQDVIRIFLKYDDRGESIIVGLKRESKPSCRVYARADSIPEVLNGFGLSILSTSKGLVTGREAKRMGVGGEVLCSIW